MQVSFSLESNVPGLPAAAFSGMADMDLPRTVTFHKGQGKILF